MRILVIGGHGKVARLLHPLLAARGHDVTAVIRNPDHAADVEADGAHALVADVESLDTDGIADLVRGHDAVVWSAGAGGGDPRRTEAVDREAAIRSMDAAAAAGVRRYVMVSYFGAGRITVCRRATLLRVRRGEVRRRRPSHGQRPRVDRPATEPPHRRRRHRRDRDLPHGRDEGSVPRADVALVVAETLERPGLAGAVVEFNTGPRPVADELDATPTAI